MEYVSPEGLRLDGRRPMEVYLSANLFYIPLIELYVFAYKFVFQ